MLRLTAPKYETPLPRARQEARIHKAFKDRFTARRVQPPQALRLLQIQPKPRHLDEFALYSTRELAGSQIVQSW